MSGLRPATADRSVLLIHPSDEAYGADRVLLRLAAGLQQRGWRLEVLISDDEPPGWLTEKLKEISIHVLRGPLAPARRRYFRPSKILGYVAALVRARKWVRSEAGRFRPSVIHVNTSALLLGAILGRPHRAVVVWHVHEIVVRPRLGNWLFRLAPVLTASHVIAVSRAVRNHLTPGGWGRRKVSVVWNGIEKPDVGKTTDERPSVVAYIGRLNRWKGLEVFVDAIAAVAAKSPSARFLIAGDPPAGEEWRATALATSIAEMGLGDRVSILGFERDVPKLMERVSIVVVPSIWPEPFGLVTLEAMRAGKAVIASAAGGSLDLIEPGRSGLLVPAGEPAALATAIGTLLDDSALRARLGAAARRRAQALFSADAFLDGVELVYNQSLEPQADMGIHP